MVEGNPPAGVCQGTLDSRNCLLMTSLGKSCAGSCAIGCWLRREASVMRVGTLLDEWRSL